MSTIPTQVGRFRILSLLGEGGMGRVFVAEDISIGRRVALKMLRPEFSNDPVVLSRFFNEARAVNQIRNEHIVDITELSSTPERQAYFVMELLEGQSLGGLLLEQARLSLRRASHILSQVAEALVASHAMGIIHRDLKPDNVFLVTRAGDHDYVKLLDFGIAKLLDGTADGAPTQAGMVMGTACYMSPEQCRGLSELIDQRSDVYSLGVILFEMLTGRVPFQNESWREVLMMHLRDDCPSARASRPDLPGEIDVILRKALAKDPGHRFAGTQELAMALSRLVAKLDDEPLTPIPSGNKRFLWMGAAAGALVTVGAVAWALAHAFAPAAPSRAMASESAPASVVAPARGANAAAPSLAAAAPASDAHVGPGDSIAAAAGAGTPSVDADAGAEAGGPKAGAATSAASAPTPVSPVKPKKAAAKAKVGSAATPASAGPSISPERQSRLDSLQRLCAQGTLTAGECTAKRAEILRRKQ